MGAVLYPDGVTAPDRTAPLDPSARRRPELPPDGVPVSVRLTMERSTRDRRQAVVARLVELRSKDRLTGDIVRAAATSLGAGERTVWRWVATGEYAPRRRAGWRLGPAEIEAFYVSGGRSVLAWRQLTREGAVVPSCATFCRAIERELSPAERAYARHGEDTAAAMRSIADGNRTPATRSGRPTTPNWTCTCCPCAASGWRGRGPDRDAAAHTAGPRKRNGALYAQPAALTLPQLACATSSPTTTPAGRTVRWTGRRRRRSGQARRHRWMSRTPRACGGC